MDLRAPLQLQTMIKSMREVVIPALEQTDQIAQEQAQLVLGMMHLMASRLPLQFHYDLDELQRYLALAQELLAKTRGGPLTSDELERLGASLAASESVLARAQASPNELEAAVLEMRSRVSSLIEQVWHDGDPTCRRGVARAVLDASKEQTQRERAWFVPQAWDADVYPPIESMINFPLDASESNVQRESES